MSMPSILSENGIERAVPLELTEEEQKSAEILKEYQKQSRMNLFLMYSVSCGSYRCDLIG